jgi:hypothetical protein
MALVVLHSFPTRCIRTIFVETASFERPAAVNTTLPLNFSNTTTTTTIRVDRNNDYRAYGNEESSTSIAITQSHGIAHLALQRR